MFRKTWIHVVAGFVVSLALNGIVYYHLLTETLDIFGYDELKDPESRHAKILYTSLLTTIVTAMIALIARRFKYNGFATGFVLPALIGLLPIFGVGPSYLDKSNYYEEFNRNRWLDQKDDRIKMARYLVKTHALEGLSREEVVRKLGNDFFENGEMNYSVVGEFCFLGIRFENNKVKQYSLWISD